MLAKKVYELVLEIGMNVWGVDKGYWWRGEKVFCVGIYYLSQKAKKN